MFLISANFSLSLSLSLSLLYYLFLTDEELNGGEFDFYLLFKNNKTDMYFHFYVKIIFKLVI